MATICKDTKATNRSGSSQLQRVLKALLPASAKIDERDAADLILFAKRYAAYLNYYSELNVPDGDWQPIMSMDVSVTLAAVAKTDVKAYADFLKIIYNNIQSAASEADRKKYFKTIFDFVFSVTKEIDQYYREIPDDFEFKEYFSSTIQARLQDPFNRLLHYYNDFVTAGYINATANFIPADAPLVITLSQNFSAADLSWVWTASPEQIELSLPEPADVSNSIYHIITHNLFNAQLDIYFKTLSNIALQSASFLEQTLTNFPSHTPHYALYLTFIQLFKKAQEHINSFTERHLDFYYKDVLRLQQKEAERDSVHLQIELQKGIEQHLLTNGTLFKGGKDVDGKEINYVLEEDVVINRASVKTLQSVYVEKNKKSGKNFETVYASSVANSEDGQGAKLLSTAGEWFPFGNPEKIKEASLGFAVASHYLYLNEATRTIIVTLHFTSSVALSNSDLVDAFTIQLTGKKGWYDVTSYTPNVVGANISFTIPLDGGAPPIVGYTEKVHKDIYKTDLPIIRFYLKNVRNQYNPYAVLIALKLKSLSLETKVEGLKDVLLQNDEGGLDPAKPFTPFGTQPRVGSSFIIGSNEIMQKQLKFLQLVVDWDKVPDALVDQLDEALHEYEKTLNYIDMKRKFHTVKVSVLENGRWKTVDDKRGMFIEDVLYQNIYDWTRPLHKYATKLSPSDLEHAVINVSATSLKPIERTYEKNPSYSTGSVNGFIKLDLNYPDFGHSAYPAALQAAASKVTVAVTGAGTANMTMTVTPTATPPKEPYTPLIKSFSVNYTAYTQIDLDNKNDADFEGKDGYFFQLSPFGYKEINKSISTDVTTVLPLYENEGELYIGFENLIPSSTLKVLFQLAEGTSNPLKDMQPVNWYYLSGNNWLLFEKTGVLDATVNFTQSGIVTFLLPATINTGNSFFDASLSWIKMAVVENADAVCKSLDIKAQVVKVSLLDDKANGIYFKKILPPNTISKLLIADAAVKKITQPYESFDGRIKERSEQFYTRVSERLRHKQRAIAAWDYEKIILEEFPCVYKAKCINHTGMIKTNVPGELRYTETLPGHVTIVTIPDLRNHTFKNPLRPYTSIGLLTNIKTYLSKLTSPFVKLHVVNPKFEEVQFEFSVAITPPLDEVFFVKQLSLDIEQFLCPWAYSFDRDIEFGGKISKSVVLNFIEERYYVDHVACFKMHHIVLRGKEEYRDVEEAQTTTGISILVSYFDEKTGLRHLINDKPCDC
jgi:hypothetical protein